MSKKLKMAAAAAIREEVLRSEQAASPGYDISVAIRMALNEDGSTEVLVTRSKKSE